MSDQNSVVSLKDRGEGRDQEDHLTLLLREGARRMLQSAIENEVQEYIDAQADERDEEGRRQVVRNGSLPERDLVTGVGPVRIQQPRVRDRREGPKIFPDTTARPCAA